MFGRSDWRLGVGVRICAQIALALITRIPETGRGGGLHAS